MKIANQALLIMTWISLQTVACRNNHDAPKLVANEQIQNQAAVADVLSKDPQVDPNASVLNSESAPKVTTSDPVPPPVIAPAPVLPPPFYPADCSAIKATKPDALSGPYKIYLDATQATRAAIDASCDMTTDGGGWTLILNYNHKGGTTPALTVRSNGVPLLGSDILSDDESAKPLFWGHAGNALLSKFTSLKELRFYCRSSENPRVVHFKTIDPACLIAAKTGTGSCLNLSASFSPLVGHTSSIPATANRSDSNKLDSALTFNTFGRIVDALPDVMWNIAGDPGLNVWECDFGSDNANFDTIHRVWFR